MATQKNTPLYGYEGQQPEYTLANGGTLPAGDLVELASQRFHKSHPGLDASQVAMAWNNLEDEDRRSWCQGTLAQVNTEQADSAAAVDAVNVMDTVGATAAKHLGAALIDAALTEVKALARPWQQMTETQQDDVLERITSQVRDAVGETIRMLATKGATHLVCELEQITVKKGAKAVLVIPKGAFGDDLLDAVGQQVILVVGPELDAAGDIPKPRPDPDQADLLAQVGGGSAPNIADDGGEPDAGAGVVHSDPED